jgi:hypothetical protein
MNGFIIDRRGPRGVRMKIFQQELGLLRLEPSFCGEKLTIILFPMLVLAGGLMMTTGSWQLPALTCQRDGPTRIRCELQSFGAASPTSLEELQGARIDTGQTSQPIVLVTGRGEVVFHNAYFIPLSQKEDTVARINRFVQTQSITSLTVPGGVRWENFLCLAPGLLFLTLNLAFASWYKTAYTFDAAKPTLTVESTFLRYRRVSEYPFQQVEVIVDPKKYRGQQRFILKLKASGRSLQVHTYSSGSDAYAMATRIGVVMEPSEL